MDMYHIWLNLMMYSCPFNLYHSIWINGLHLNTKFMQQMIPSKSKLLISFQKLLIYSANNFHIQKNDHHLMRSKDKDTKKPLLS